MKIYYELDLHNFEAWLGAKDTLKELSYEQIDQLSVILDELYDELGETDLNDLLWFKRTEIRQRRMSPVRG